MYGLRVLGGVVVRRAFLLAAVPSLAIGPFLSPFSAPAALIVQGDVSPDDPAAWTNETEAFVGKTAPGSLNVIGGGSVESNNLTLGRGAGASGALTVGGAGSLVEVQGLTVGESGEGAIYVINGGTVDSRSARIGLASGSEASANIIGPDSLWRNRWAVEFAVGADASLSLIDGGRVMIGTHFLVGSRNGSSHGNVTISGTTSALDIGTALNVFGGTITAVNGGRIRAGGTVTVDADSRVVLLGPESELAGDDALDVSGTMSLLSGATAVVAQDTIVHLNGAMYFENSHLTTGSLLAGVTELTGTGTIETRGLVSDVDLTFASPDSFDKTIVLNELPLQHIAVRFTQTSSGSLGAGFSGSAELSILNGMNVACKTGYLGYETGSYGSARVRGIDSQWRCESLFVGLGGEADIVVESGGSVAVGHVTNIAGSTTSTGTVSVRDSGSSWTGLIVWVGAGGEGTMYVENGAKATTGSVVLGAPGWSYGPDGIIRSKGTVVVDGQGSSWTTSGLIVGQRGEGSFVVRGGAVVDCGVGYVGGDGSGATDPRWRGTGHLLIDGPGTILSAPTHFGVGAPGQGGVQVTNSGTLNTTRVFLGSKSRDAEGTVGVDGIGSVWTNKNELRVGDGGSGIVDISNGGLVSTASASLAAQSSTSQGTATVDGLGSALVVSQDLVVGKVGYGVLNVEHGGLVTSMNTTIGAEAGSTGVVTVTNRTGQGLASIWLNRSDLTVGGSGNGTLRILDRGRVESASAGIGRDLGSKGLIEVRGHNAKWINEWGVTLGSSGEGNLYIADGGAVKTGYASIRNHAKRSGRADVVVEGASSEWVNGSNLDIGRSQFGPPNGIAMRGGAMLRTYACSLNSTGVISLDVNGGSTLVAHEISNRGRVFVTADAATSGGEFTPFDVDVWRGDGSLPIPLGGIWSHETQVFTVRDALCAMSGETVAIDLAHGQRVAVCNEQSGYDLSLSFNAESTTAEGSSLVHVTADADDASGRRGLLLSRLPQDAVLAAHWDIDTDMSPLHGWCGAYLSMEIGTGLEDVRLWTFGANGWTELWSTFFTYTDDAVDFAIENSRPGDNYQGGYNGGLISLAITAGGTLAPASTLPGDLNGDGLVGSDDLDLVRAYWGTADGSADVTADGIVDSADLDVIRANWGTVSAAVPEPGTWLMMMAAAKLALFSRRYARRPR